MVIKDAIGANREILNMLPCESHTFANYYGILSPRESVRHTVFNCILFTKALANRTTMWPFICHCGGYVSCHALLKYIDLPKIRHTLQHAVLSSDVWWPRSFQPALHQACQLGPSQATILAAIYNPTLPSSPTSTPGLWWFCFDFIYGLTL